jgi:hypothetical protein
MKKRQMKKPLIVLCVLVVIVSFASYAHATLMQAEWQMNVIKADLSNSYGLSSGDTISGFAFYDNSSLAGVGVEYVYFGAGSGNHMQFNIPTLTFYEMNAYSYTSGESPWMKFEDGSFVAISYIADVVLSIPSDGANYRLEVSYFGAWRVTDWAGRESGGNYGNFIQRPAPVPEPATMLLLASGLVGLAGVRKKFKK